MSPQTPSVWAFEAIGTHWEIQTDSALNASTRVAVEELIDGFDHQWSRFRPDSAVSELARTGGTVPAPADAVVMLDAYAELSEATGGAVNPLIGDTLAQRGYDARYSFTDYGPAPAPGEWQDLLSWDKTLITLRDAVTIDVGAVGKGRLVDRVLELVTRSASGRVVVDAGGDLAVHGGTIRVALEDPYDSSRAIGVVELADQAMCASAINRRTWGDGLHHVLDARTGIPVGTIAATWAIAPDAMRADAIATALFFDAGPALAHHWGITWVRMTTDGRLEWSPRSPVELFT